MPLPRLTWAGLLVATLGWGFLLAYPLIASLAGGGSEMRDPARFILIFGENAILSGFAIALLGLLETIIGLLARQAATVHPAKTAAAMAARSPQLSMPAMSTPPQPAAHPFAGQQLSPAQLMTPRHTNEIVTRGALSGRDYVLFRDGSVVVETLLGPRRFMSLTEAQDFIGTN